MHSSQSLADTTWEPTAADVGLLFDVRYYLQQVPEAELQSATPFAHYLRCGAQAGYNPHPLFDTSYYLQNNPDVARSAKQPLVHYICFGAAEGRNPHPLFDTAFYLAQFPDDAAARANALLHYIDQSRHSLINPHPLFDARFFCSKHTHLNAQVDPLSHYVQACREHACSPTPLFDAAFYAGQQTQPAPAGQHLFLSYLRTGAPHAVAPHPLFDAARYVAHSGCDMNPLLHFALHGAAAGLTPHSAFDTPFYVRNYRVSSQQNALSDFLLHGWHQGRDPNANFSCAYYVHTHADVATAQCNPLVHHVMYGAAEERSTGQAGFALPAPVTVSAPERPALVVLGMHRSGTSAVTRVLNLLGADLPNRLMQPEADNRLGFWESLDLFALNEELFAMHNLAWHSRDVAAALRHPAPRLELWRQQARRSLHDACAGARMPVLKDPRLCRLLPLWHDAFHHNALRCHYILPIRHPLEVAASLNKRNGMDQAHALDLWLHHVVDAERATRGAPRVFISYDALLDDWHGTVEAIAERLRVRWPRTSQAAAADIEQFLSPNSKNHRASAPLPVWIDHMYQQALAACGGEIAGLQQAVDCVRFPF